MQTNFWIEEKSPKFIFENFIQTENTKATLWEIFTDYAPIYTPKKTANTDKEWLVQQTTIIDKIIIKYFSDTPLNKRQIELLIDTIQELMIPEGAQDLDTTYSKHLDLAEQIVQTYLLPLQTNQTTLDNLLDALEDKLVHLNKEHIVETNKEALRQEIRLQAMKGNYSKERVTQMLQNLEMMWASQSKEEAYEEEVFEEEIEQDDFIYSQISLAVSNTFYGFNNDAGNLSYQEQEYFANEKFKQYKNEVTDLLGQKPDKCLQPELHFQKIEANDLWASYYDCIEENPFMFEFEGGFTAWKKDKKVLFLSMNKEDKELPYLINLGGLTLKKYEEILEKYHKITLV